MAANQSVDTGADARQRSRTRRADRFEAQNVLWRETSIPRVKNCGRVVHDAAGGVTVKASGSGATRTAGLGGLQSCGSVWACPVCAAKVAAERSAEVAQAVRTWQSRGNSVVMVTLTMRHYAGQELAGLWDAVGAAWTGATSGRGWILDQRAWGFLMPRLVKTGARAGQIVTERRVPTIRVVEVTHGKNGWHVHVHALLFVEGRATSGYRGLGQSMFGRWARALARKGYDWPLMDQGGLDVRVVGRDDAAAAVLGDYFAKQTYDGPDEATRAALEVTRGDLKDARHGNRTPFAVLRSVYLTGDAADLDLWHTWEQASHNRRQLTWSPGLRALLEVAPERTDEEIAEDDAGGTALLTLSVEAWASVRLRRAQLLDAAEQDDTGHALRGWLDGLGVRYTVGPPVPIPSP